MAWIATASGRLHRTLGRSVAIASFAGLTTTFPALATPSSAQTPPLRVEHRSAPVNAADTPAALEVVAGVGLTLVFRVLNPADVPQTAVTRVERPAGWQVLFASDHLLLSPRASAIDTVRVVPPRNAEAGDYSFATKRG